MSKYAPLIAALSIGAFLYPWRDDVVSRLRVLYQGRSGLKFVPVVICVIAPTLAATAHIAQRISVLQWSLFSTPGNVLTSGFGIAQTGESNGVAELSSSELTLSHLAIEIGGVAMLIAVLSLFFIMMNYEEEEWGRKSWAHVGGWAVTHLLMGVPLLALPPVFAAGSVYKYIFDNHGFEQAYAAHVGMNVTSVCILGVISVILTVSA